jgi:MoaA/NifB/PqqE/SkfB family radical SAM enzyme
VFNNADYIRRGLNFANNRLFPHHKKVSSLMIYATDLCDSACKHCLIWAKRPPKYLSLESIVKVMESKCILPSTIVGLEGGEFLLHPEAEQILSWFKINHPKFDLFSNCLKPDNLINAVKKYAPHRLYISLDGDEETYKYMRGKDGYSSVLKVIRALKKDVPLFIMFTLSPYNDYDDLKHVAAICKEQEVFLRVGIYNNIPFFDTIDNAKTSAFGQYKNKEQLTFTSARQLRQNRGAINYQTEIDISSTNDQEQIPVIVKDFKENYDYIRLYDNWVKGELRLKCHSILDSVIILPDGSVPICQNLNIQLGNIHDNSLDDIFNSEENTKKQHYYCENCNQCWISYHRKYDIILYRNFEKFFGKWAAQKMLGFYKWDTDENMTYRKALG